MKQFKHLVFAGTFDYLHIGHKRLLDRAFELAEKVSIGITTEKLYKSKPLANLIQTWQVRRRAVTEYLRERNWLKRARFFRLDDIYGPAIVDRTMDSILVTKLTKPNTELINKIRKKKGLPLLRIIVAPLVRGDDEEIVTSERIRMGEIDREGHNFQFLISNFQKKSLILPKYLRKELRKPLGILIKSQIPITNNQSNPKSQLPNNKTLIATSKKTLHFINRLMPTMVITVGDIITESLLRINIEPEVKLIDFRTRRQDLGKMSNVKYQISKIQSKNQKFTTKNPPGTISISAIRDIKRALANYLKTKRKQLIIIKGEEDLLALPAILLAPLHSLVLYGQIDLGVVIVEVTVKKKKEVEKLLKKFD